MSHPASPAAKLRRQPRRFTFDAAIRVLQQEAGSLNPADIARFRAPPHLAYPGADILAVGDGLPATVQTTVMALVGATGVLPRGYTEQVTAATRARSHSLHAFIDLLADRLIGHFAAAGAKYRIARAAEAESLARGEDRVAACLLALTGYALDGQPGATMADRLACGRAPLLHYGGFMSARPRSAARLGGMASDYLGRPVQVVEFQGAWLGLPPSERTVLGTPGFGGMFCRLGEDAALGVRAWDVQGRIALRVGPLSAADFAALLPGGGALERFVALVRAYLGFETGFAVNLVVARAQVPALRLDAAAPARLGWSTWLPGERAADAEDATFEADIVEALSIQAGAAA